MKYKNASRNWNVRITKILPFYILMALLCMPKNMSAQSRDKISLMFSKFDRTDKRLFHSTIQLDFESILQLSLLNQEYDYWQKTDQNYNFSKWNQIYVDSISPDVIVYGSYALYENSYEVKVNLFFSRHKRTKHLEVFVGDLNNPYLGLSNLSKNISISIDDLLLRASNEKKVAIIWKSPKRIDKKSFYFEYYSKLTTDLTTSIDNQLGFQIIPWEQAIKYYGSSIQNEEIVSELDIDGLLVGVMEQTRENKLKISPDFYYIKDDTTKASLKLNEISEGYYGNIPFIDQLVFRSNNFFKNVVKKNSDWNFNPYLQTGEVFNDFINLGDTYAEKKLPSISNFYLLQAQSINNNSSDLHTKIAHNYLEMGRFEEARQEFSMALEIDSSKIDNFINLYNLYINQGEYESALNLAKRTIRKWPNEIKSLEMLGISNYYNEKYEEAKSNLNKAKDIDTTNANVFVFLAFSQQATNQFEQAVVNLKKAKHLDSEKIIDYNFYIASTLIEMSLGMMMEDDYASALKYMEESQKYYQFDYLVDHQILVYLLNNNLSRAIEIFNFNLESGYYDESIDYYNFALSIRTAFLADSCTCKYEKEYGEEIIKYIKKHLQHNPERADANFIIGNTYSFLNKSNLALEYLQKAYDLDKNNKQVILDLCEGLLINGYPERSIEIYEEVANDRLITDQELRDGIILDLIQIGNIAIVEKRLEEKLVNRIEKSIQKGGKPYNWYFGLFRSWVENNFDSELESDLVHLVTKLEELGNI